MSSKSKTWAVIMRRELSSYFTSPVAYIVAALFLIFGGFFFFSTFFLAGRAELRGFFELLPILFSFFIPALTMRCFSEEKKTGSIETLMTLPVKTSSIVAGKYLAAFISSATLLVPTLFYVLTCLAFSSSGIDAGPVIGGYIGAILLASSFSAIGVFASSVTDNQIMAFFIALAVCIVLVLISIFSILVPAPFVEFVTFISATGHFHSISRGIIDSRDVIYFLSITALFIVMTVHVIENSKK